MRYEVVSECLYCCDSGSVYHNGIHNTKLSDDNCFIVCHITAGHGCVLDAQRVET